MVLLAPWWVRNTAVAGQPFFTLQAFAELIREGKVRAIGASNYGAPRLAEAPFDSDRKRAAVVRKADAGRASLWCSSW